jgi:hypothetical protein
VSAFRLTIWSLNKPFCCARARVCVCAGLCEERVHVLLGLTDLIFSCRRSACDQMAMAGVSSVDVYYLHQPDPETPLEETLRAAHELHSQVFNLQTNLDESLGFLFREARKSESLPRQAS